MRGPESRLEGNARVAVLVRTTVQQQHHICPVRSCLLSRLRPGWTSRVITHPVVSGCTAKDRLGHASKRLF